MANCPTATPVGGHFRHQLPWHNTIRYWHIGPVLVNDMQTSPQKEPFSFFGPKWREMFWNEWKIHFPIFVISEIFKHLERKKKSYHPKRCAMFWNRCSSSWVIFVRFLVFELWSILYFTFVMNWRLTEIFKSQNLIQKRKPAISENQLAMSAPLCDGCPSPPDCCSLHHHLYKPWPDDSSTDNSPKMVPQRLG